MYFKQLNQKLVGLLNFRLDYQWKIDVITKKFLRKNCWRLETNMKGKLLSESFPQILEKVKEKCAFLSFFLYYLRSKSSCHEEWRNNAKNITLYTSTH